MFPYCFQPKCSGSLFLMCSYTKKSVDRNTLARNYILHFCMTHSKLKTMNKKTHQIFKKFCCLPYHVLPASVGAIHIYICFYVVLANNKQMTEERYILQISYILQIISDEHQNSTTKTTKTQNSIMSTSWEDITV